MRAQVGSTLHGNITKQVASGSPSRCGDLISDQVRQWVPTWMSTNCSVFINFTPISTKLSGWWPKQDSIHMGSILPWLPKGPLQDPWTRFTIWWAMGSHNLNFYFLALPSGLCFLQLHAQTMGILGLNSILGEYHTIQQFGNSKIDLL